MDGKLRDPPPLPLSLARSARAVCARFLQASVGLLHDLLRVLPRETREYCAGAHQQVVHALLKEAHEDEQCQELARAAQAVIAGR